MTRSLWLASTSLLLLTGCHSAMIQASVHNGTDHPLQLIEVDYPSASFGTQGLNPGATFNYRFKVLGSGPLKLLYTDKAGDHTVTGPELQEGLEGKLVVEIGPKTVQWQPSLHPVR